MSEKVYSGGSKYRGELSGERREGYGIYYYMEGDVCGGKWSEDSLT